MSHYSIATLYHDNSMALVGIQNSIELVSIVESPKNHLEATHNYCYPF